jgi:hypothetical protein
MGVWSGGLAWQLSVPDFARSCILHLSYYGLEEVKGMVFKNGVSPRIYSSNRYMRPILIFYIGVTR